jgi:Ca2+-binding RTX toxin-like protein
VFLLLTLAFASATALIGVQGGSASTPTCFGEPASLVGTNGNDHLRGTQGDDVIDTLGGSDTVVSRGGNDRICSGSGHDGINAGSGADRVNSGSESDFVILGDGNDLVYAGGENDAVYGGPGNDRLFGGDGRDYMIGAGSDDYISGGAEGDALYGVSGTDDAVGDDGWDTCVAEVSDTCESSAVGRGCPPKFAALVGVWSPYRLTLVAACYRIGGTVTHVESESDGDLHFNIRRDDNGELLVVEFTPRDKRQFVAPSEGHHLRLRGALVRDTKHDNQLELHPVWREKHAERVNFSGPQYGGGVWTSWYWCWLADGTVCENW